MALADHWFPPQLKRDIVGYGKTQIQRAVQAYEYDCSYRFPRIMKSIRRTYAMSEDQNKKDGFAFNALGGLLPIGAAVVAIALGWGEMRNQMDAEQQFRKDAIAQMSAELSRIGSSYENLDERSRFLEDKSARIEERFIMLVQLMTDLKVKLDTLDTNK